MSDQPRNTVQLDAAEGSRWWRPTVGTWFGAMAVAFLLGPLLVSNLWGYMSTKRYLTEAAFRNIRNVAALEAAETLEFVRGTLSILPSITAGNQHLFEVLHSLNEFEDSSLQRALTQELNAHLAAKQHEAASMIDLQVISPGGVPLGSSVEVGVTTSDPTTGACLQMGMYEPTIVGFDYGESTQRFNARDHGASQSTHGHAEPTLVAAAPINDGHGTFLGVLCARFSFDIHRSLLVAHRERTSHAILYLLDDRGRIVCGSFDDLQSAPYGESLSFSGQPETDSPDGWEGRFKVDTGEEVMVAYARVPDLGWGVVAQVPVRLALADLEKLRWQATLAIGIIALLLAVFGSFGWRMVVRPLKELSSTSDHMATGAPGETVPPRGLREVSELARAFNRMSLALKESHDTLESRIVERTRELQNSREFLQLLLDSIDQRVIVMNSDYEIIKANQAAIRMHGRRLEGETSCEIFEGTAEPPADYPARITFETGEPAAAERSQRTVHGLEPVYLETYPIFDANDDAEGVVEIARIVTAEKKLQMQMVYQAKMAALGQLAAGIAHELGNPLASIESQLQLAQGDLSRVEPTLEVVGKQVRRMHRMLRRLVDFTRRRGSGVTLASANQAVEDVAQLLEQDPRARAITIERSLAENLPGIRTDPDHLVQILLNLGLNGLDAIPSKGALAFETDLRDGMVRIRVRDTGGGISEATRSHLFEPFFTTKGPDRGSGLGLFVSKGIVEEIGGRLELEETSPMGTTFAVYFKAEIGPENRVGS